MELNVGTDYFETFEVGRDSHVVIAWDYFSDKYRPLYFKSEDRANQYFQEHIKELSESNNTSEIMAIKGCCVAAITQTVKIDYVITGGKINDK